MKIGLKDAVVGIDGEGLGCAFWKATPDRTMHSAEITVMLSA